MRTRRGLLLVARFEARRLRLGRHRGTEVTEWHGGGYFWLPGGWDAKGAKGRGEARRARRDAGSYCWLLGGRDAGGAGGAGWRGTGFCLVWLMELGNLGILFGMANGIGGFVIVWGGDFEKMVGCPKF